MNKDTIQMKVDFETGEKQALAIEIDEKARTKAAAKTRLAENLAERAAYEKLGIRVLKLKAKTYRMLKSQIDELGIKTIGHCGIIVAREKAESVVAELDAIAKKWDSDSDAIEPETRVALQRLKLDCIKLMIESGAEHLRAERQPMEQPAGGNLQLAFPAGKPMIVAIGQQPEKVAGMVE